MEVLITKETLKDVDYIIEHLVEKYVNDLTNIDSIAVCLNALVLEKERLEKAFKEEEEEENA